MTALVGRRVACVQEREEQSVCSARVAQPLGLTSAPRRLCRGGGGAPRLHALQGVGGSFLGRKN